MVVLDPNVWQTIAHLMQQFAFTPCIPTGHLGFLSSCQARECSGMNTHWRGALCAAALPECGKLPRWMPAPPAGAGYAGGFQAVLALSAFSPLPTSSWWLLLRDPISRWHHWSSYLSKVPLLDDCPFSCPCARTTDKSSRRIGAPLCCLQLTPRCSTFSFTPWGPISWRGHRGQFSTRMTSSQQLSGRDLIPPLKLT